MKWIDTLGGRTISYFLRLKEFVLFVLSVIYACLRIRRLGRYKVLSRQIIRQVLYTGVQALPIVSIIAVVIGITVIAEAVALLPRTGRGLYLGYIFVAAIVRELGPILTAFIVIGRSGTAIAVDLSSMAVNNEVSALRVMRIDPIQYLVLPRIIGVSCAACCLYIFFGTITLLSGYVASVLSASGGKFFIGVSQVLSGKDIVLSLFKSFSLGLIISLISCFFGLSAKEATTEVPQVTMRAVISSMVACFVFSGFITVLFY